MTEDTHIGDARGEKRYIGVHMTPTAIEHNTSLKIANSQLH